MNRSPAPGAPVDYRLRVEGHLAPRWSHRFGDLTLTLEDDGTGHLFRCWYPVGIASEQTTLDSVVHEAHIRRPGDALATEEIAEAPVDGDTGPDTAPATAASSPSPATDTGTGTGTDEWGAPVADDGSAPVDGPPPPAPDEEPY